MSVPPIAVHFILAVLLMLFAALPHPALLAGMRADKSGSCTDSEFCADRCQCCPQGQCACADKPVRTPPPQPFAPARSGPDCHSIPTLPPAPLRCPWRKPLRKVEKSIVSSTAHHAGILSPLPLHVRLCVFLI
jgi:hypothetical protein